MTKPGHIPGMAYFGLGPILQGELVPCGYEIEIEGKVWRCVHWKHTTDRPHYLVEREVKTSG